MKNVPIFSKLLILLFAFVVSLGIISTYSLETLEKSMVDGRKEEIKAVTDAVLSVAQHYQGLVESGELTQEDAIERFYADMVALRFSDGIGYFFSSTSDGTLLMHAASPALKGQNIWNFKGASGGYVIRNIVAAAQNGGEYFVDLSTKPGKPKDQFFEKLYYAVTLPWGDHIGTGLYIDDINDAFRAQATNIIMFSGFALVVILGLGLVISRGISSPLRRLESTIVNLSDSEHSTPLPEADRRDEIGKIARNILTLRTKLAQEEQARLARRQESQSKLA